MMAEAKKRLDNHLRDLFPGFSRAFLQKFIRENGVLVRGRIVRNPGAKIAHKESFSVTEAVLKAFLQEKQEGAMPCNIPEAQVLFEDRSIKIIDKPHGIRSENFCIPGELFLVHRLDKDTSGILVLAKNEKILEVLQKLWQERKVKKEYLALVRGKPASHGFIDAPLIRSRKHRKKITVLNIEKSRLSQTEFRVIETFGISKNIPAQTSLLRAFPVTGRTHQIRVHFSAIKHPVIGDSLYGDLKLNGTFEAIGLRRQFLHAAKLSFPYHKKTLTIESPLAEDLNRVLEKL